MMTPPAAGLQRAVGGVQAGLDGGAVARHARRLRQALLVRGDERHRLDQRVHVEGVVRIVGVGEAQRVAQLGDAVLDLDAGVHLHEVVAVAVDDALEGRRGVELHGACRSARPPPPCARSTPRSVSSAVALRGVARGARLRRWRRSQPLLRDRHLDQLLLVHLQRAVAAAERDAPLAVAEDLDLVVARLLDVELDQHVLVVADAGRLDLGEHLAHQRRHLRGVGEDALALAAAAADRLQAEAPARVLLQQALGLDAERLAPARRS